MSEDDHPSKRQRASKPSKAPNFSDPASLVTFIIGPGAIEFKVDKEFVYYRSAVLKAAFESPFIEGQTQVYTMDDVSPRTFKLFVQWVYGQQLDIGQLKSEEEKAILHAESDNWGDEEDLSLAELWVLGDKLIIPELQNLAIKTIIAIATDSDNGLPLKTYPYVYENTADGSPLRRLCTRFCYDNKKGNYTKFIDVFPKQLLIDYILYLEEDTVYEDNRELPATNYYVSTGDI